MGRLNCGVTTAAEMARKARICPKVFRSALRRAAFSWHMHNDRWTVPTGSGQQRDMQGVLDKIVCRAPAVTPDRLSRRNDRDETWVIDQCDLLLGCKAWRQHRFAFLRGDVGANGRSASLPVDAFYQELSLVIEYNELQHSYEVPFWDRKQTISGLSRGEQRRRYDERRRTVLPVHGVNLLVIDVEELDQDGRGKLQRTEKSRQAIEARLLGYIS
ncbi:hypothetical protein [Mangrovicoccus ximenensis]|uniref:hypothetical protein n=1 Tax=Mangrovicoccus ximenensis TaxID=1911570 RepID=UPI0011AE36A6|nr:hypothetical protein [Mangrovicoccus ximenensis]